MAKGKEPLAQVTAANIGRTIVGGYDEHGLPIDLKIPHRRGEYFVTRDGNIIHSPLANGRAVTNVMKRRIMGENKRERIAEGMLPLYECPHTTRYTDGRPLVPLPKGAKAAEIAKCQGGRFVARKQRIERDIEGQGTVEVEIPTELPDIEQSHICPHMEAVIAGRRKRRDDLAGARRAQKMTKDGAIIELARRLAADTPAGGKDAGEARRAEAGRRMAKEA